MKRILKRSLKALWRAMGPIRRPLASRFDAKVSELVSNTVNARMMPTLVEALAIAGHRLERIERTLERADRSAATLGEEMDLVLQGLSREVFRLQAQVEALRDSLDREGRVGLSIVEESDDDEPVRRPASSERSRVG